MYIQRFMEVRDRVLRKYFGDEYIDKIYKQNTKNTNHCMVKALLLLIIHVIHA